MSLKLLLKQKCGSCLHQCADYSPLSQESLAAFLTLKTVPAGMCVVGSGMIGQQWIVFGLPQLGGGDDVNFNSSACETIDGPRLQQQSWSRGRAQMRPIQRHMGSGQPIAPRDSS